MNATPIFSAVGLYLAAAVVLAAGTSSPTGFEAHTTGAKTLTLRGPAQFGTVEGEGGAQRFVLTLGAEAPTGAVIFTWADSGRPEPGVYDVSESRPAFIRALIVTGGPTRPTGVFRARAGTLTVSRANGEAIEGSFELEAVGFEAADPSDEGRPLVVRGSFNARGASM